MNEFDATWYQDVTRIGFGRQEGDSALSLLDVKARQVATLPDSNGLFSPRLVARWAASSGLIRGFQEAFSFRFQVPEVVGVDRRTKSFQLPDLVARRSLLAIRYSHRQADVMPHRSWTDTVRTLVVLDRSTQEVYAFELEAQ